MWTKIWWTKILFTALSSLTLPVAPTDRRVPIAALANIYYTINSFAHTWAHSFQLEVACLQSSSPHGSQHSSQYEVTQMPCCPHTQQVLCTCFQSIWSIMAEEMSAIIDLRLEESKPSGMQRSVMASLSKMPKEAVNLNHHCRRIALRSDFAPKQTLCLPEIHTGPTP